MPMRSSTKHSIALPAWEHVTAGRRCWGNPLQCKTFERAPEEKPGTGTKVRQLSEGLDTRSDKDEPSNRWVVVWPTAVPSGWKGASAFIQPGHACGSDNTEDSCPAGSTVQLTISVDFTVWVGLEPSQHVETSSRKASASWPFSGWQNARAVDLAKSRAGRLSRMCCMALINMDTTLLHVKRSVWEGQSDTIRGLTQHGCSKGGCGDTTHGMVWVSVAVQTVWAWLTWFGLDNCWTSVHGCSTGWRAAHGSKFNCAITLESSVHWSGGIGELASTTPCACEPVRGMSCIAWLRGIVRLSLDICPLVSDRLHGFEMDCKPSACITKSMNESDVSSPIRTLTVDENATDLSSLGGLTSETSNGAGGRVQHKTVGNRLLPSSWEPTKLPRVRHWGCKMLSSCARWNALSCACHSETKLRSKRTEWDHFRIRGSTACGSRGLWAIVTRSLFTRPSQTP